MFRNQDGEITFKSKLNSWTTDSVLLWCNYFQNSSCCCVATTSAQPCPLWKHRSVWETVNAKKSNGCLMPAMLQVYCAKRASVSPSSSSLILKSICQSSVDLLAYSCGLRIIGKISFRLGNSSESPLKSEGQLKFSYQTGEIWHHICRNTVNERKCLVDGKKL